MTKREVIAAWLAERDQIGTPLPGEPHFRTVNEATLASFLADADDLLDRLDRAGDHR